MRVPEDALHDLAAESEALVGLPFGVSLANNPSGSPSGAMSPAPSRRIRPFSVDPHVADFGPLALHEPDGPGTPPR